jgi:carboxyl-terminal processing protease
MRKSLTLTAIVVLVLVVGACSNSAGRAQQQYVSAEALQPLWEVWEILHDGHVDQEDLDSRKLAEGAVRGLLNRISGLEDKVNPRSPSRPLNKPRGAPSELQPLWDTWVWLFETQEGDNSLENPSLLTRAAISGLLEALDDPHTGYISPERYAVEGKAFRGEYEGIGAEIYKRGSRFILNPMPESPAEMAGIRAGDSLLAVDGKSVAEWGIYDAVSQVRGPKGTPVKLEVQHLGMETTTVLEVIRGVIDVQSVFWNTMNDEIAYVRMRVFNRNTDESLETALQEIEEQDVRGLVLDLRNNPGGLLSTTVVATSYFLDEGLVTYEINAEGNRSNHKVEGGELVPNLPMVVLVNQFSASGSEVMAGALQDHARAIVVGMRTFGKGSVSNSKALSDGGGLYYSVARWYTPKGRLIEGKGLEPDVLVPGNASSRGDPQLEKALELLTATDQRIRGG